MLAHKIRFVALIRLVWVISLSYWILMSLLLSGVVLLVDIIFDALFFNFLEFILSLSLTLTFFPHSYIFLCLRLPEQGKWPRGVRISTGGVDTDAVLLTILLRLLNWLSKLSKLLWGQETVSLCCYLVLVLHLLGSTLVRTQMSTRMNDVLAWLDLLDRIWPIWYKHRLRRISSSSVNSWTHCVLKILLPLAVGWT